MANYSLYSSLDDSNNIANILSDFYRSSSDYDPFADYALFRTSQYNYILAYGDLEGGDYKTIEYNNSNPSGYSLSFSAGNNFMISSNGYHFIGNISGGSHSQLLDQYKTNSFIILGISCILVVLVFTFLRKHKPDFSRSSITLRR